VGNFREEPACREGPRSGRGVVKRNVGAFEGSAGGQAEVMMDGTKTLLLTINKYLYETKGNMLLS
jgi:hypothetical protein